MTRKLKVLVGCETSGIVRDAFLARGHDAWSCDILPADTETDRHMIADVREVALSYDWDLAIFHPPCTRLCNSGVRWLSVPPPGKTKEQIMQELDEGAALFSFLWNLNNINHIAVENPVMHKYAKALIKNYRPQSQTVQPWQFATDEHGPDNVKKRTCFWLRNLPNLRPTGTLDGSTARSDVHLAGPSADRWKIRSRFFPGMAAAMADQWGLACMRALGYT